MTIGILGGGLSGCVLGSMLLDKGLSFEILEAEEDVGGLLRTRIEAGYTFDTGGPHIIFSKNKEALDFLLRTLGDNFNERRRNAKILFKGRYIKYPFENGLSGLPIIDNIFCLLGFTKASLSRKIRRDYKAKDLKRWCLLSFGGGISERYLLPYNEKIWKHPLDDISTGWVERIPSPPWKDVAKSSLGLKSEGYTHQLNFNYPVRGGIQSVIRGITRRFQDRITTGFRIRTLRKTDRAWVVSDGEREKSFETIVSTLPLPVLAEVADMPAEVRIAANSLISNSLVCILIGGVEPVVKDMSWLYIPGRNTLTHRVSFLSSYSPEAAPRGKTSILADITCKYGDDVWSSPDEALVTRTVGDLHRGGVLKENRFEFSSVARHRYAYVIDDLSRSKNLSTINSYCAQEGILNCGRFAEFEYLNMDDIVMHAAAFIDKNLPVLIKAA